MESQTDQIQSQGEDKASESGSQSSPSTRWINSAGLEIFSRHWKPVSAAPRALVFLAHGYAEHSGYYEELAQELLKESFYVFAHDHIGHGQSQGSRVHVDSVDEYVRDVLEHFERVNPEVPEGIPRFIVGHSMGGTIAIQVAMKRPDLFRGVVLVAPAVIPNPELATPIKIFLAKVLSRVAPQFPLTPIEWKNVTRNQEMVEKMSKDKLCYQGRVKVKWAVAMLNALQEIHNNLTNIEWPFYVLHGNNDVVTDISGSVLLNDAASSKDKQIKVYENASHNLLQELDDVRHAVLKEISSWIVQRLTTPPEPADTTSATIAIATTAPATTSANATTDIPASEGPTDAESPNSAPVLEIEPSETATESSSILTEPNVDDSSKTETPPVDQESTEASVEKPVVQETTDDVVVESRTETEQDTSEQVEVTTCNE